MLIFLIKINRNTGKMILIKIPKENVLCCGREAKYTNAIRKFNNIDNLFLFSQKNELSKKKIEMENIQEIKIGENQP